MEPLSRTERDWGARLTAERGQGCLEADQLLSLAERGRRTPNAADLYAHIAACPGCRAALKELKQVEALRTSVAQAPAAQSRWFLAPRILWPMAAAAAILLLYFTYRATLPGEERAASPEAMANKGRTPEPAPRSGSEAPLPERMVPTPAPKVADPTPEPEKPRAGTRSRKRSRPGPARTAIPNPIRERPLETMDANIGWSRDELSGEVVGENVAVGEVIPPNQVQGEVRAGGAASPPEPPAKAVPPSHYEVRP